MRPVTIARNYAEALFDLGEQTGQTDLYAQLLDAVAAAVETSARGADDSHLAPGAEGGEGADPGLGAA